ncbi:hypothetical protein B0H14DRAFT_3482866 [Mycena olivaceomarginata]|nr:hypothetical protein B0H14DRAFT_3482866 [Mycena olivaceomarginata]
MPSSEDAESTYAKAVKAEFSKDYDAAFRLYIKAAESFLHLSRSVDHDREKTKWKTSAGKALERAEKIKAFVDNSKASSSDPSRSETRLTPVGVDHFSRQEQSYAVKKGGIINGRSFPLWDDKFLSNASPDALFEDSDGEMGLSPEQSKVFPEWRQSAVSESDGATADWRLRPQDILQHVITDCSVRPTTALQRRMETNRCVHSVQTASELTVALGPAVIDGKLPYHPTTGALVCMSSAPIQGRSTTWPSLTREGGQCMLTVGTGVKPNINWRGVRLLPSHSYAVIDVKGEDAGRGFTVLDSWVRSDESNGNANRTSAMLEIPWMDVLEVFESVYLSWDPRIWPKTLNFHGTWKQTGAGDQRSTRHLRLKFDNANDSPQDEVWILLTRHVADTRRTSDFTSLRVQLEDDLAGVPSLRIPDKSRQRSGKSRSFHNPEAHAAQGMYTNSTHVLAKTRLPGQAAGILSVFAAYDGHAAEVGFTLSVYAPATAKIAWDESVPTPPFTSKVEGALTSKNAGGNSTHPTFMQCAKADVALSMQIGREVPVSIAVAWSQGTRLFELAQKDLAATSGAYSYAGDYTIILSAFEPNQFGAFSLQVESSLAFDLKPIPQEGAGMYAKTVRGAWTAQNAMGGPSFKHYAQNPVFELDVQAPTELKYMLAPSIPSHCSQCLHPESDCNSSAPNRQPR